MAINKLAINMFIGTRLALRSVRLKKTNKPINGITRANICTAK